MRTHGLLAGLMARTWFCPLTIWYSMSMGFLLSKRFFKSLGGGGKTVLGMMLMVCRLWLIKTPKLMPSMEMD